MADKKENLEQLTPAQRALLAVKEMRGKLDAMERAKSEPIAVIGLGCRFPGGANSPREFWELLRAGRDAVSEVPPERWDVDEYYDPNPDAPGKMYVRHGGFVEHVDKFDPAFFGVSPREAAGMDPQQRLLMETAWEALEHGNIVPSTLHGSLTGVFVGISTSDYLHAQTHHAEKTGIDAYFGTGNAFSVACGRLSYTLGLQGPCLAVDTACSSSLVAVHLACQSLRNNESQLALAGGVNAIITPGMTINFCKARMLAPDGRCKTFDEAADGYVRGEGCGFVVLKRLSDAERDGDRIYALIRGSAVNQDGKSNGLTAPNGPAQEAVIQQALANAKVAAHEVGYVEAHGTGTSLGDPIEMRALGEVMRAGREAQHPLYVASAKTNFGHLEAAAGIAGLIKVVLALHHAEIPPHLHFKKLSPHIALDHIPAIIPTQLAPFPEINGKRLAGLSSFGFSGTNAHIILQGANEEKLVKEPSGEEQSSMPLAPSPMRNVLTLSAKSEESLRALALRYAESSVFAEHALADVCFAANTKRSRFEQRLGLIAESPAHAREQLAEFARGKSSSAVITGVAKNTAVRPKIAFLFTGQGAQYLDMGKRLYETQPLFRAALDKCDAILRQHLEVPLLSVLFNNHDATPSSNPVILEGPSLEMGTVPSARKGSSRMTTQGEASSDQSLLNTDHRSLITDHLLHQTCYTQPALFAIEYALAELWQSWGITPSVVLGHSVGEYVAACVAGMFSLEDGLKLIATRGRLMQALPQNGAMAALFVEEEKAAAALVGYEDRVSIAAINDPANVVISGEKAAVEEIVKKLEATGVKSKALTVSHAFHSPLMEPMLDAFEKVVSEITFHEPRIPIISNLTALPLKIEDGGSKVEDRDPQSTILNPPSSIFDPQTYYKRHVREAVRFSASIETLRAQGYKIFLEVGPQPVLTGMGMKCVPEGFGVWLPSLRKGQEDELQMLKSLAGLHVNGVEVDWNNFHGAESRVAVPLPTYAFKRERFWFEESASRKTKNAADALKDWLYEIIWQEQPRRAQNDALSLSSTWLLFAERSQLSAQLAQEMAQHGARGILVFAGEEFQQTPEGNFYLNPTRAEDYERLLQHFAENNLALAGVVHAWSLETEAKASLVGLEAAHDLSTGSALLLAQALHKTQLASKPRVWFMTRGAQAAIASAERSSSNMSFCKNLPSHSEERHAHDEVASTREGPSRMTSEGDEAPNAETRPSSNMSFCKNLPSHSEERHAHDEVASTREGPSRMTSEGDEAPNAEERPFSNLSFWKNLPSHSKERHAHDDIASTREGPSRMTSEGNEAPNADERPSSNLSFRRNLFEHSEEPNELERVASTEKDPFRMTVMGGAEDVSPINPAQAPLWGFARVLALEHPELWGGIIDLGLLSNQKEAAQILAELHNAEGEDQIALREDKRFVARLVPNKQIEAKPLAIHSDASYLITGGLGNLGLVAARWLVHKGARHLVLTGRTGLPERATWDEASSQEKFGNAINAIRELEKLGATIHIAKADVGREEELRQAWQTLPETLPALRGVIHAAGVSQATPIQQMSPELLRNVLKPKVTGTWLLHELTQNLALDFFVCYSSISAIWGSQGLAHYAAANHFLDGFAHHRRALGLPALSLNWAQWEGESMASREAQASLTRMGLYSLPRPQAINALEMLLASTSTQKIIANVDWSKFKPVLEVKARRPLLEHVSALSSIEEQTATSEKSELLLALEEALPSEREELLLNYVREHAAKVLGLAEAQALDPQKPLAEFGLDSLMAVELRNALAHAVGKTLPSTLLFDFPTLEALCNYLLKEALSFDEQKAATQAGAPAIAHDEPIAVIGMACRFPGANDLDSYWRVLREGLDAITEVPTSRWDLKEYYDPDPQAPGKMYCRFGGFIEQVEAFDAQFFGIAPREAQNMDPQQLLLLEVAWEALEHAGIGPDKITGSRTGVFLGMSSFEHTLEHVKHGDASQAASFSGTSGGYSYAAGRLSYFFGLQGPCMTLDTACSSSLVAAHLACQSLRNGESNMALVAGVNVLLSPDWQVNICKAHMLAEDGRCKTFDESADGFVRSDGCGVVVLKRLADAIKDNDNVLALIRGSAVNQDGKSSGMTAPNGPAQEAVMRAALASANVQPHEVSYVETHGTGTALGDAIETRALANVMSVDRAEHEPLFIGTVKTNLGHLEAASGVAGLIKLVLALQHEEIPRHLHFKKINLQIALEEWRMKIPLERVAWPEYNQRRIAGLSAFGLSGTNAHLVVEEFREQSSVISHQLSVVSKEPLITDHCSLITDHCHLLTLSAKSEGALKQLATRYVDYLTNCTAPTTAGPLYQGSSCDHEKNEIETLGQAEGGALTEHDPTTAGPLYENSSRGHETRVSETLGQAEGGSHIDLADLCFTANAGRAQFSHRLAIIVDSLAQAREELSAFVDEKISPRVQVGKLESFKRLKLAFLFAGQGAYLGMGRGLFATQPAFRKIFEQCDALLRESLPASLSDVLYAEDAAKKFPASTIRLCAQPALFALELALAEMWKSWGVTPSVVMGESTGEYAAAVVAGVMNVEDALGLLVLRSRWNEARAQKAQSEMEKLQQEFEQRARAVQFNAPQLMLISSLTGKPAKKGEMVLPEYWISHLHEPSDLDTAFKSAYKQSVDFFIEIAPHEMLNDTLRASLPRKGENWLPSLIKQQNDAEIALRSLAKLYVHGAEIDWRGVQHEAKRRVHLPSYPFQREVKLLRVEKETGRARAKAGKKAEIADWFYAPSWKRVPLAAGSAVFQTAIAGKDACATDALVAEQWLMFDDTLGIAAQLGERLECAGRRVVHVQAGDAFAKIDEQRYVIRAAHAEDYVALVEELKATGRMPTAVAYLWSVEKEKNRSNLGWAEVSNVVGEEVVGDVNATAKPLQERLEESRSNLGWAEVSNVVGEEVAGDVNATAKPLQERIEESRSNLGWAEVSNVSGEDGTNGLNATAKPLQERLEESRSNLGWAEVSDVVGEEVASDVNATAKPLQERIEESRSNLGWAEVSDVVGEEVAGDVNATAKPLQERIEESRSNLGWAEVSMVGVEEDTDDTNATAKPLQEHVGGFGSLLYLTQALEKKREGASVRFEIITQQAHDVIGESALRWESAPTLALGKVIPQEFEGMSCRVIDVVLPALPSSSNEEGDAAPNAAIASRSFHQTKKAFAFKLSSVLDQLVREINSSHEDRVVAYRGRHRWVQSFEAMQLNEASAENTRLREHGVYLILGGLGRVGYALAEMLAKTVRAKLVLIGRTELPRREQWQTWLDAHLANDEISRRIVQVQALEQLGAEVLVLAADATSFEQMQTAFAQARGRFGEIHGVIHAAGARPEQAMLPLEHMNASALNLLAQREKSLLVLEKVTQNLFSQAGMPALQSLDFCLLLSSLASVLGGKGAGVLAAEGLLNEAFAQRMNQTSATQWLHASSEAWRFEENTRALLMPEFAMTREEGVAAVRRALAFAAANSLAIATGDLPLRHTLWIKQAGREHNTRNVEARHERPSLTTPYVAPQNQTEATLAEIWQDLLGLKTVGMHDNFFELGGTSLLGVSLFAQIETQLGKKLPLNLLMQSPTIAQLATFLAQDDASAKWSPLVMIQPNGPRPPLYCVHPGVGTVLGFHELSKHLGHEQPFYGIQARGLDGKEKPFSRIEPMAAYYLREIRGVQPHGPYLLSGRCFGGLVAYEMAQQLLAAGERVALLAIIDTVAMPNVELEERAFLEGKVVKVHSTEEGEEMGEKWRESLMEIYGPVFRHVGKKHDTARKRYVPQPYRGRVTLFRNGEESETPEHQLKWAKLAQGGLDVHVVPGDHKTILLEPHVSVLAERLRACIEAALSE